MPGRGAIRFRGGSSLTRHHLRTDARPMPVARMTACAVWPLAWKRLTN